MHKPVSAVILLILAALGWTQDRRTPVVPLGDTRMILEWAPGQEAVVRLTAENEEGLERLHVLRPDGRELVDLDARASAGRGLSGLEIELREPDLERLFESYPEGSYTIRAATVGGSWALGHARLSLDLPSPPRVVHPGRGELVEAADLTVVWLADREVAGYELQLEQDDDDGLRVRLPPERSSFQVPQGLLAPGTETALELVAIGANGNRTVSEVRFITRP